jgi:hypothetical protein
MTTEVHRGDLVLIETAHSYAGAQSHGGGRYHTFQLCLAKSINVRGIVIRAAADPTSSGFMVNKHLSQRVFALGNFFDHDAAMRLLGMEFETADEARSMLAQFRRAA